MKQKFFIIFAIFILSFGAGILFRSARHTGTSIEAPKPPLLGCVGPSIDHVEILRRVADGSSEHLDFIRELPPGVDKNSEAAATILANWNMTLPVVSEANNSIIANLPNGLCDMRKEHDYKETDQPNALGLDPPAAEVILHSGPKFWSLRFGTKREASSVIAAVKKDSDAQSWDTFWAPNKIEYLLQLPESEFQNRNVVKMWLDNIQALKLTINGKESFSLERQGADWIVKRGNKSIGPANDEATKFVNRLSSLQAVGWEDTNFAPDNCDKMQSVFTVSLEGVAGRKETIHFSAPQKVKITKEPRMLTCNTARRALFHIHGDMEKYLRTDMQTLLSKKTKP